MSDTRKCVACKSTVMVGQPFCDACGAKQTVAGAPSHTESLNRLWPFLVFFGLNLVALLLWRFVLVLDGITFELSATAVLSTLAVAFALLDRKRMLELFAVKQLKLPIIGMIIAIGIPFAFMVYYSSEPLNYDVESGGFGFHSTWEGYELIVLLELLFMAVQPAIFEEIAFRGFMFNAIEFLASPRQAVIVTSILFFFIHFAFISFYWMLPFAFVLGWLRMKHNTLWYGIIAHFVHNATVTLIGLTYAGHL